MVTIRDIAKRAGLSIATVSRTLREPEAVFCANDEMAIGAQRAIREHGLVMPTDIAMVGFDDLRFGAFANPPLSTVRQPTAELGETAVRMLDAALQGMPFEPQRVILPHQLVIRESSSRI